MHSTTKIHWKENTFVPHTRFISLIHPSLSPNVAYSLLQKWYRNETGDGKDTFENELSCGNLPPVSLKSKSNIWTLPSGNLISLQLLQHAALVVYGIDFCNTRLEVYVKTK